MSEEQTEASDSEGGCQVDWRWLEGRHIRCAESSLDQMVITFSDGETLTIRALLWKAQPFLSFDPWRQTDSTTPSR